jgi:hypothetical protein
MYIRPHSEVVIGCKMPCYYPITGYRSRHVNKTGKRSIVFNTTEGFKDLPVTLSCGRCIGCRLEASRTWAVRCVHEAQMHEENVFITLTYNNENLPEDRSIHKEHLQKFFKRLRKNTGKKFRYFACGEYGDKTGRPHYHAILFGIDFPDKQLWSIRDNNALYRSDTLEASWKYGFSTIGEVTFESAAYVARYVMKKHKGTEEEIKEHYQMVDEETGELFTINPEFCLMSRRPGIGKTWLEKYKGDTDKDYITVRGNKMSLPKYYDTILEKMGEDMEKRKSYRLKKFKHKEHTQERLKAREKVKRDSIKTLQRNLEEFQ